MNHELEAVENSLNELRRKKKRHHTLHMVIVLVLITLAVYSVLHFVIGISVVDGGSMKPAIQSGDIVIFDRIANNIQCGDIVITISKDEKTQYIKRVIGIPGDQITLTKDGKVEINGAVLEEPYEKGEYTNPMDLEFPIKLGEDEYFVLGDNRSNSTDSRSSSMGNFDRKRILGKTILIVRSLH